VAGRPQPAAHRLAQVEVGLLGVDDKALVVSVFLTMLTSLGGAATFAVFGLLAMAALVFVHRYA
jgi:hypothetical protein